MGPSDSCARHALSACSVSTPHAQASRVAHSTLHACRAHYPGGPPGLVDCFHLAPRPSPLLGRVGAHVSPLGTCSGFTRVAACVLARPPFKGLLLRGFGSGSCPPSPPDGFRGASTIPRAGLPPAGECAPSRRTQKKRTKSRAARRPVRPRRAPRAPAPTMDRVELGWVARARRRPATSLSPESRARQSPGSAYARARAPQGARGCRDLAAYL
jgi:hypothetical protein